MCSAIKIKKIKNLSQLHLMWLLIYLKSSSLFYFLSFSCFSVPCFLISVFIIINGTC